MPPLPKPTPRAKAKAAAKRRQAKADRAVYAAVTARDGGVCRGCGTPDWMGTHERHHIVYRSRGGKTTRSNVALLCLACHADVHAGRLRISGDADGVLTFTETRQEVA